MLKIAGELSVLKDEINYILNKLSETENVLRRENSVSTYSQERKLSDLQDLAFNLMREFDKISDNFYQAAKAYESTEDKLNSLVNINKDNNIRNIIAVNSINNTYFSSDNTKSEEKEETEFDKLKELAQEGWSFITGYFKLNLSAIDFMKDVCDNINTFIDGYLIQNKELIAEFNEKYPELSILFKPVQGLMGVSDGVLKFAKEMTFGLGSDVLGMLSSEYHGLLENPGETLKQNVQSLSMLRALLFPVSKEELETRNNALSGIWSEIKTSINTNLINGDPYTASRFITDVGLNIASLFFGAGELKAAAGVKKADNVIDGVRAIEKVSDANKLSNGEKWFNYFNKTYGAENVEWTSKVFEGNAGLRERVFANIEKSRLARESTNYSDFAKFEKTFGIKLDSKISVRLVNEIDRELIEKVKNIRKILPSKYKKSGNFAYADVSIEGAKERYFAHSGIDSLSDNSSLLKLVPEISVQPEKPNYNAIKAVGKDGSYYLRDSCTEYKILNEISDSITNNVVGEITLFTELDPCDSCKNVFNLFLKDYPNIKIKVIHNNGIRIIRKNGY